MSNCFHAADILLPQKISMKKWSCVACDQYSSQLEYWDRVSDFVGNAPSTFHMIYPEAILRNRPDDTRLQSIHQVMNRYIDDNFFRCFRRSFVFVERTMNNGAVRHGLIGQIDLEQYDYDPESMAEIRATEGTVKERLPARMNLLREAKLEFPHVLLLCDDVKNRILGTAEKYCGETLYDFDLMENGGHISGRLISGLSVSLVNDAITDYIAATKAQSYEGRSMAFAVGDGNHSLAAAKACWEEIRESLTEEQRLEHPSRYALVELENIHDAAIEFEAIHRVLTGKDAYKVFDALRDVTAQDGYPVQIFSLNRNETVYLSRELSPLAVAILQPVLDRLVSKYDVSIDYIHGYDVVRNLSQQDHTVGLILPDIDKNGLFPGCLQNGVLPRKTFSMGHANEKRYYLEGKYRR